MPRKSTAQNTSVARGDDPTPRRTYRALLGVPRWAADATRPKVAKARGTMSQLSSRLRMGAPSLPKSTVHARAA